MTVSFIIDTSYLLDPSLTVVRGDKKHDPSSFAGMALQEAETA